MSENQHSNYKNYKQAPKGGENNSRVSENAPGEAIQAKPLEVKVYGNNFEKALKIFRALVQKERILSAYKEKQIYEKPSNKRRRKLNERKRKLLELESSSKESSSKESNLKKKNKPPKDT